MRTINFYDPVDKTRRTRIMELLEQILALHKKLTAAKTDYEKRMPFS